MNSRKISVYITIVCVIVASLISTYVVYFAKPDIMHTDSTTRISLETYPQIVMGSLDDLSLKGYLTTSNNVGISNKDIQIILKQPSNYGNQTKDTDSIIGNTTTDQSGCFYFNEWDNNLVNKTLKEIPQSFNSSSMIYFNADFVGTKDLLSSSNITNIRFSPIIPPIIRPAIGIDLSNNTSLIQDMNLKRGQSYAFDLLVFRGSALFSPDEKLLKLDIKGLPCGVNGAFENNMVNLTEQYNATAHMSISVDNNAKTGEYYYFIIGNDWTLREAKLIIE